MSPSESLPRFPIHGCCCIAASTMLAVLVCSAPRLTHADDGPIKVFILAGQSNMEGQAVADLDGKDYNDGNGTLAFLMRDPAKAPSFKHLKDDEGRWTVRDDVWVRYRPEPGPVKAAPLTLGFTVYGGRHHFGPELEFGHVVGDRFTNQVLPGAGLRGAADHQGLRGVQEERPRRADAPDHKEFYFGVDDFFPFNRAKLLTAEPEIFDLMQAIWGPVAGARLKPARDVGRAEPEASSDP